MLFLLTNDDEKEIVKFILLLAIRSIVLPSSWIFPLLGNTRFTNSIQSRELIDWIAQGFHRLVKSMYHLY